MAGGKKKKKPAANPARGFATTSIVSKARPETVDVQSSDAATEASSQGVTGTTTPDSRDATKTTVKRQSKDLKDLSPDELEARLKQSELQQIVDQHAVKIRRDAARQISKLETDRRLLRPQCDELRTRIWLGDDNASAETSQLLCTEDPASKSGAADKPKAIPSDVLLQRLWVLRLVLEGIGLSQDDVDAILRHCLAAQNIDDPSAYVWGLAESLEWAALHVGDRYQPGATKIEDASHDADPDAVTSKIEAALHRAGALQKPVKPSSAKQPVTDPATQTDADLPDMEVSDTDSDLDPDELLSKHLSYKLKLVEHRPEVYGLESSTSKASATSHGEGRLLSRLKTIESDPLFDQDAADLAWRQKRAQAFQEQMQRRKLGIKGDQPANSQGRTTGTKSSAEDASAAAEAMAVDVLRTADEDSGGLFEGIFDEPDATSHPTSTQFGADEPANLVTRHLDKITGVSPRRILEEACKARDSGYRLNLKMVSPTTYHCRHLAHIRWSKDHDLAQDPKMGGTEVHATDRSVLVEMTSIATTSTEQSEGFVCTAALFAIFSGGGKEDKASLRLPPSFRDLYQEFAVAKQERQDEADRKAVKELRDLIEQAQATQADQDVVLTKAFRDRQKQSSGTSTPNGSAHEPTSAPSTDPTLQDLWNRKSSAPTYQKMLEGRRQLPMHHFKEQALEIVRQHQVTILCGETGCGKSTQMPSFILEDELSKGRNCKIYCTEPRRISAISLAHRVSEELGEGKNAVGTSRSLVGYAIRLESQTVASTRLIYATVGIVLRMLESKDGLKDLTHLIIDEVHERSIDTDFLLIVLRTLMVQRPDLKVILMSATVDADRFSRYLGNAPVITVPGRTFPVRALYLEDAIEMTGYKIEDNKSYRDDGDDDEADPDQQKSTTDSKDLASYSKATVKTLATFDEYRVEYSLIVRLMEVIAKQAEMRPFSKAVLIFLPGIAEIRQLTDMLTGHPTFAHGWLVYPLHSTFSNDEQQAAFHVPPRGMRKIVLATNIAETGITIPDVTCVIDAGKHKEMRFDERRQLSRLIQSFISRANAKQRRGRAGRVQEGICFHLFTKHRHDTMMAEQQTPEMLRLSLQDLVMRVKICKLGDVETALSQALDPPSAKNIRRAIDALVEVGALTSAEELTALGQQLAKLPLDAQLGKLILLGSFFGCLDFALTIAASASSKSPFLSPMNARRQADTVRLAYKRGDSDLLTTYNAYVAWRKVCTTSGISEFEFCRKNFLSSPNLANIEELKGQLLSSLVDAGVVSLSAEQRSSLSRLRHSRHQKTFVPVPPEKCINENNDTLVSAVVAWSFYPKILKRDGKGWRSIANSQSLSLHPTSVNKLSASPSFEKVAFLSFYSIMQSTSRFTNAQETTPVEPMALVLLAGEARFDFYSGVVVVDGNRLRFRVEDWRDLLVLKALRGRMREMLGKEWRRPGRDMGEREGRWFEVFLGMFERFDEARKAREGK